MSTNGQHTENTNRPEFFEQFTGKERETVKELWEDAANAAPARPAVSPDEVEKAWQSVGKRIGHSKQPAAEHSSWRWVAAAAVLLLVAGVSFIFTPKTVEAPRGEMAQVTLPDGSTVQLNSGSEIKYNRLFGYTNREIQMKGEAFFSVEKAQQPFIVQANRATVRVTGTRFNVRSWKAEAGTEVAVAEGSVLFSGNKAADHPVTVTAGESSKLKYDKQQPTPPGKAAINHIIGWRSNSMMFDDKSLRVIFDELERRFDVEIAIEDSAIGQRTLTAYYSDPGSVASVLQDICRVKGLKFAPASDGFRVYE